MLVSHDTNYLRCPSVDAAAKVLSGAGLVGVVLPGRGGWCEVLLPPKVHIEQALGRLAEQGSGVLRFQHNDYGRDIRLLQGQSSLSLDPKNLTPWIDLGLIDPGVPAQIARVGVRAISWLSVLKLPPPLHRSEDIWKQSYVPVPGARVVGLQLEVEGDSSPPAALSGEKLIQMLVDNEALVLADQASLVPDFCAAWEREESAESLMTLLLGHPGLDELYLSDAAWAQAVAAARASD